MNLPDHITYSKFPDRYVRKPADGPTCFLAGGITDCRNWQEEEALPLLALCLTPLVIVNPRQAHYPATEPTAHYQQFSHEQDELHRPFTITLFHFPESPAVQPTAESELWQCVTEAVASWRPYARRPFAVSAEPGYARRPQLVHFLERYMPKKVVHSSLSESVAEVYQLAEESCLTRVAEPYRRFPDRQFPD